jgi:hypothetical protein
MINIAFLGDISLNDDYIKLYKQGENPFKEIESILCSSDYVIGNLESLLVGNQGENINKKPRLKTTIETLTLLKTLHLNVAALAHNHIYDHYEGGYLKTIEYLNSCNILTLGAGESITKARTPIVKNFNDIRICILNYVDKNTNPYLPEDSKIFLNNFDINSVLNDIKEYRNQVDFVICYLHWGGKSEYSSYPYYDQPKIAKKIIDSGCDLVIGSHTHTLQPFEIYKGKYIFYSLGNFCFSDLYFEGKTIFQDGKKAKETVILQVLFKNDGSYDVKLIGIINKKLFLNKSVKILRKLKKRNFIFNIFQDFKILWRFNYFLFNKFHPYKSYFFNNGVTNRKCFFKQFLRLLIKLTNKK